MAKNKHALNQPDAFVSAGSKAVAVLEKNWMTLLAVFIGLLLAGGATVGYQQWQAKQEQQAEDSLAQWFLKIQEKQESLAKKSGSLEEKPQVNFEQDFGELVENLKQEIAAHPSTLAAQAAAMKLADFYVENDKQAEAAELLKVQEKNLSKGSWLFALYKLQLASLLSQAGDIPAALQRLDEVANMSSAKFIRPEAWLKMALLYEKQGELEKSKNLYTRVSTEYGDSEAGRSAKSYLRLMEIQENLNAPSKGEKAP